MGPGRNGAFRAFEHTVVEYSELVQLARPRAGHFDLGTGYHGDLWLDLDALFLRPARLRPYVDWLAERLRGHGVDAVCGPLEGARSWPMPSRIGWGSPSWPATAHPEWLPTAAVHGGIGGWRVGVVDDAAAVIALGEASTMVPARLGVPFYAAGTMPSQAWPAPECPLCADGFTVTPGAPITPGDGRSAPPAGR
jgi:orotate phosphoribosyltransferase